MKKRILFLIFLLLSISLVNSCSIKQGKEIKIEKFVYKDYFLLDSIAKTLDPVDDINKIVNLNKIPDSMVNKWIRPFREVAQLNKMVSYQYRSNGYHVIIVMVIDEINSDKRTGAVDIPLSSQYLLTVKSDGSLIAGLKIAESFSKDHLEDSVKNRMEIMTLHKWSELKRDTVKTYNVTSYLKETVLGEKEDYIETPQGQVKGILENVLQEEFEGTDTVTYLLDLRGKIKKINENKGELRKVSEQTGEKIKLE